MSKKKKRVLIFTDLDGTLLDSENYSFEEALPALEKVKKRKIPLILCSSKTRAELEVYQKKLKIEDPFISENGGGVFIPRGYFRQMPIEHKKKGEYLVLELGTPYRQIRRKFLEVISKLNVKAVGFGDLTSEEISSLLNLSKTEAKLAKEREYDEPFYFLGETKKEQIKSAEREFKKSGLGLTTGGRLFHLTGDNDKGKAVKFLARLYKNNWGYDIFTIGLGDSLNDLPMLESVDTPVLVRKEDNSYDRRITDKLKVYKAQGIGPPGWNQAILDLMEKCDSKAS